MTTNLLEEYLTRDELARQLRKSTRTLERWDRLGKGPRITRVGMRPLYHVTDVRAWLASLREGGEHEAA